MVLDLKNLYSLETRFSNFQRINPDFAKVKIHIMYEGLNRNNTYFDRDTIMRMIPTLYNIPVVGEWIDGNDDFGSHGGKVEISDQGIKFIDTTKPYGVVPSDTEVTWERIREKDGITENDYLTCWAYLWLGRYPEIEKILNSGANQSMEIYVENGEWNEEQGYYNIKDAYFSALCILGSEVEPCFESADIKSYSSNKEKFKSEFDLMLKELKSTLNEGGDKLDKLLELLGKYTLLTEDDIIDLKENIDQFTIEELEAELQSRSDAKESFDDNADNSENDTDEKDDDETDDGNNDGENNNSEDNNNDEDFEVKYATLQNEVTELNKTLNELNAKLNELEAENNELKAFKAEIESKKEEAEKEELFEEFSVGLTNDEMQPIKDEMDKYSVVEIRSKLNEVFTAKNLAELKKNFTKTKGKDDEGVKIDVPKKNTEKSRYACD